MLVRCINDNWDCIENKQIPMLIVGEAMPQKDKTYEVIGYWMEHGKVKGYKLAEFDFIESYKIELYFNCTHFEIADSTFVPNALEKLGENEVLVRKVSLVCELPLSTADYIYKSGK